MGGPSSKAKYFRLTDSEPVPWGKGEKNPGEGSEIEPETVCVQAVGAPHLNYFVDQWIEIWNWKIKKTIRSSTRSNGIFDKAPWKWVTGVY